MSLCVYYCQTQVFGVFVRKGDMFDLRIVTYIFLKFVSFGANFRLLFIFAISMPNRYFVSRIKTIHFMCAAICAYVCY